MDKVKDVALLNVRGLAKYYGHKCVLKDVSFSINHGEKVAIVGRSGAGKTTLLGLIGGLISKSAGSIEIEGRELQRRHWRRYRRDYVGLLLQRGNLIEELTAAGNVEVAIRLSRKKEDSEKWLSLVGLADKADKYPFQLSGGERRRVALARALAKKPSLLLLDEPTEGLDDMTGLEIIELVERLSEKEGITLLLVTHNTLFAKRMDRCFRLEGGTLTTGDFL